MEQTLYVDEEKKKRKKRRRRRRRRLTFLLIVGFAVVYLTQTSRGLLLLDELKRTSPDEVGHFLSQLRESFTNNSSTIKEVIAEKLDYIANFL